MPQKVFVAGNGMPPVNTSSYQLYFNNIGGNIHTDERTQNLYKLPINVSRRLFPIPPTITAANRAAHDAIRTANADAVWLNYRPLDVNAISAGEEATFYLSNEVVETNPTLQQFSGRVDNTTNEPTNFQKHNEKEYFQNTYVVQKDGSIAGYTMGGCMGCHGTVGQNQGGDFSRLLANGRVSTPDPVDEIGDEALRRERTRKYFSK